MIVFGFDAESSSYVDISLGADTYTRDKRTRCLMFSWKPIGSLEPHGKLWREGDAVPKEINDHVINGGFFSGWNVIGFDRLVYRRQLVDVWGFPLIDDEQWRDSMHLAAAANLPRSLDGCAGAVGFPHDKSLKDQGIIKRITNANRTVIPGRVADILDYPDQFDEKIVKDMQWLASRCIQDVVLEEGVLMRLPPWPDMKPWISMPAIDRKINDRGAMVDLPLVQGLEKIALAETHLLDTRMSKVTGGAVPRTTNVERLKTWLISRGVELPPANLLKNDDDPDDDDEDAPKKGGKKSPWRLAKFDIANLLARTDLPEDCRFAIEYRSEAAKAATGKLHSMSLMADDQWRLRGTILLGGAQQTMRFSSVKVQLHNTLRDVFANPDDIADTNGLDAKKNKEEVHRLSNVALATAIVVGRSGDPELVRAMYETTRKDAQGRPYRSGVINWVSRMVRRCITVRDGHLLLSGDWAQIEARITVWLAQQMDMVNAFASGEDVYRIAAAGIFRTVIEKITKLMRQTGKVSILACIAENQMVLTDQGEVPIQKVTTNMKIWDGVGFVHHDGIVCRGNRDVIQYDGLIATSDHEVWLEGKHRTESFLYAGARLLPLKIAEGYEKNPLKVLKWLNSRPVYDILNCGPKNRFTVSGRIVHNCGFGGGANALVAMGYNYGLLMTHGEASPIVKAYRDANSNIERYWYASDDAAIAAVQYPGREFFVPPLGVVSYFVPTDTLGNITADVLCCRLPSGRLLRYWQPRLRQEYWDNGRPKDRLSLSGLAIKGKAIFRRSLYHTILVENQVQGIGADMLCEALVNCDEQNVPVDFHVHDSAAADSLAEYAQENLELLRQCMLNTGAWAPGLPIGVDAEASARFG